MQKPSLTQMLLFAFLVLTGNLSAQYRFNTSYNAGSGTNQSHMHDDLYPDWRGGFYTLSTSMGTIGQGGALVRLNPDGTIAFSRFVSGDGTSDFKPTKLVVSSDKFIYMSGYGDASYGYSTPVFVKTDSLGNVIWSRTFELMSFQGQFEARSMVITSDGGFLTQYSRSDYSVPMGQTSSATVLVKVNSSGSLQWAREFRGATINTFGLGLAVMGNEIGVLMNGSDINNTNLQISALYIINNSGTVLKSIGAAWDQSAMSPAVPMIMMESATKKANGEYLIGCNYYNGSTSAGLVIQTDNALGVMNSQFYSNPANEAIIPRYLKEETNGDISVLGLTFEVIGVSDGVYLRLNSGLVPQTAVAYGDSRSNDMFVFGKTTDQGFYLGGSSMIGMDPFSNQSTIYKVDKEGNLGCSESQFAVTSSAAAPVLQNVPLSFNTLSFVNFSPTINFTALTLGPDYVCSSLICDVQISGVVTPVNCFGNSNGAVNLTLSNTNGAYTVAWTGPSFTSSSEDISGLAAGGYSVTVTDAIGCTASASYSVTQPSALTLGAVTSPPSCSGDNDGSINLTITGGTAAYTFSWSGPNSFSSSQEDINGLLAGVYNITVNDANNCTATGTYTLNDPASLGATFTFTQPSCNGGTNGQITANGTGGIAPYTYAWLNGGPGTATYPNIPAGTYQVLVSDNNGCLFSTSSTLTQPSALTVSETISAPNCQLNNGVISVAASGGVMPYSYAWTGGATTSSISGLDEGSYTLTLTDGNACVYTETFTLDLEVDPVQICVVTVDTSSQHNVVIWDKPVMNGVSGYNIYRLVGANYTLIDFWPYDSLSQYTDSAVGINPNITSYRYRISVVDSCGNESAQSDFHETMHLTVNQGTAGAINLIWDNYEGLSAFTYYKIGRFVNGSPNWVVIDSVTSANTTYTDLNAPLGATSQYRVQIVLDNPCVATRAINHNSTRSNRSAGIIPNSVNEQTGGTLAIYPNPGTDLVRVEIPENAGMLQLEIMDITGALISSVPVSNASGTLALDLSHLASGVYLMRMKGTHTVYQSRWVKQN